MEQNVVVRRDVVFNEMDFGQPHPETQREPPVFEVGLHNDPGTARCPSPTA